MNLYYLAHAAAQAEAARLAEVARLQEADRVAKLKAEAEAEKKRLAEVAAAAEKKRIEDEVERERQAEAARQAEIKRLADEEEARKAAEAAEIKRQEEEATRLKEEKLLADIAAEEKRQADEAEAAKAAENKRLTDIENKRLAEEAAKAEAQRVADEAAAAAEAKAVGDAADAAETDAEAAPAVEADVVVATENEQEAEQEDVLTQLAQEAEKLKEKLAAEKKLDSDIAVENTIVAEQAAEAEELAQEQVNQVEADEFDKLVQEAENLVGASRSAIGQNSGSDASHDTTQPAQADPEPPITTEDSEESAQPVVDVSPSPKSSKSLMQQAVVTTPTGWGVRRAALAGASSPATKADTADAEKVPEVTEPANHVDSWAPAAFGDPKEVEATPAPGFSAAGAESTEDLEETNAEAEPVVEVEEAPVAVVEEAKAEEETEKEPVKPDLFESWVTAELLSLAVTNEAGEFGLEEDLSFDDIQVGGYYVLKSVSELEQVFANEDSIWSQELSGSYDEADVLAVAGQSGTVLEKDGSDKSIKISVGPPAQPEEQGEAAVDEAEVEPAQAESLAVEVGEGEGEAQSVKSPRRSPSKPSPELVASVEAGEAHTIAELADLLVMIRDAGEVSINNYARHLDEIINALLMTETSKLVESTLTRVLYDLTLLVAGPNARAQATSPPSAPVLSSLPPPVRIVVSSLELLAVAWRSKLAANKKHVELSEYKNRLYDLELLKSDRERVNKKKSSQYSKNNSQKSYNNSSNSPAHYSSNQYTIRSPKPLASSPPRKSQRSKSPVLLSPKLRGPISPRTSSPRRGEPSVKITYGESRKPRPAFNSNTRVPKKAFSSEAPERERKTSLKPPVPKQKKSRKLSKSKSKSNLASPVSARKSSSRVSSNVASPLSARKSRVVLSPTGNSSRRIASPRRSTNPRVASALSDQKLTKHALSEAVARLDEAVAQLPVEGAEESVDSEAPAAAAQPQQPVVTEPATVASEEKDAGAKVDEAESNAQARTRAADILFHCSAMLGLQVRTDIKKKKKVGALDEPVEAGATVEYVRKQGPAAIAGLLPGHVVLFCNSIEVKNNNSFIKLCKSFRPGDPLRLEVDTEHGMRSMHITVVARELDLLDIHCLRRIVDGSASISDYATIGDIEDRFQNFNIDDSKNNPRPAQAPGSSPRYLQPTKSQNRRLSAFSRDQVQRTKGDRGRRLFSSSVTSDFAVSWSARARN